MSLRFYFSIVSAGVSWLWYPYILHGKLTVLQGDPGEGKSTLILNVTALLTKGKPMPDGPIGSGPHKVLYQCAKDDIADTVKPRLVAAGADCSMTAFIQDDDRPLTLDMVASNPSDPDIRYMFPVKSSLAPEGAAIAFTFDRDIGLRWLGPYEFDLDVGLPEETSYYSGD